MMMNKNNVTLAHVAGTDAQLFKGEMPQFAFSGRSNVGKSSLINRLLSRKSLARVSGEPGKTITVNYYDVDHTVMLVDLPGYGYAKRSVSEQKRWSRLVEGYFRNNHRLVFVLQLIDLKVGPTQNDLDMLDWLYETKTPFIVVATKTDKLNVTNRKKQLAMLREHESIPDDVPIIPFSSLTGEGVEEIWRCIEDTLREDAE